MAMEALRIAAKESKVMKFILGGFIFLAVGGLVFADVGGYFRDGVSRTEVAQVNDTKIALSEFDRDLKSVLLQSGLSPDEAYDSGIVNAYLDGRINNTLQLQASQNLNLYLDNKTIAQQMRDIFGDMTREQIEMSLRAQGLTEQSFANSIRSRVLTQYVSSLPQSVANYAPNFINKAEKKLYNEQRSGNIYKVKFNDIVKNLDISDTEIQDYYNNNIKDFTEPESRDFIVGIMTLDMAKSKLPNITDSDLKLAYEDNIDNYKVPETRKIAQATVKNPDDAQNLYEMAMEGTSLSQALKNITGNTAGYRDAVNYEKSGLPTEFSDKAFKATVKKGDIIAPIKTLLGYTVLQVTEITPPYQKSFDDLKDDLQNELKQTQIYDSLYNKMIDTEDMIDSGVSFNEIATKTGLKTETTTAYTENEAVMASGIFGDILQASPSILEELYALPINGATYPLELDDQHYVVVGVKGIYEEKVQPLNDVKSNIVAILTKEKQKDFIIDLVESENNDIQDSKLLGDAKTYPFTNIKRSSEHEYNSLIYASSITNPEYLIENDQLIIANISNVSFKDSSDNKFDNDMILQNQNSVLNSLISSYHRENANIIVNNTLLKDTYSPTSIE